MKTKTKIRIRFTVNRKKVRKTGMLTVPNSLLFHGLVLARINEKYPYAKGWRLVSYSPTK